MKKILIIVIAIIITGCSSIKVTPPGNYQFDRSREYSLAFDEVWTRAVDWFADHNVTIDKVEKSSGLITAKYPLTTDDRYVDCGKIESSGTLGPVSIQSYATVNVTVRSVSENTSRVNANVFGEYRLDARDAWDGRPITGSGQCVSTGKLELSILDYISR